MISNYIRAFHEVVQCGSIRKASDKMRLAPSSVSRRVAVLERQVGTPLLDRSVGGVTLTHAGRLVAEFVAPVIMNYDALCRDLNDVRGLRRQIIRICASPSVAFVEPGVVISRFRQKFDTVTFKFDIQRFDEIIKSVKANQCDIGISLLTHPDPELQVLARIPEPIVLAVRAGHPFATRTSVSLAEVAGLPLALLDEKYAIRRLFDQECRSNALSANLVLESCDLWLLTDFVRNSGCASLMPRRTIQHPDIVAVTIESASLNENALDLIVLRSRRLPRLIRLFVQELTEHLTQNAAAAAKARFC